MYLPPQFSHKLYQNSEKPKLYLYNELLRSGHGQTKPAHRLTAGSEPEPEPDDGSGSKSGYGSTYGSVTVQQNSKP